MKQNKKACMVNGEWMGEDDERGFDGEIEAIINMQS